MFSFREWCLYRAKVTDDQVGDFVRDSRRVADKLPDVVSYQQLRSFVLNQTHAHDAAREAAALAWKRYQRAVATAGGASVKVQEQLEEIM